MEAPRKVVDYTRLDALLSQTLSRNLRAFRHFSDAVLDIEVFADLD